MTSLLKRNVIWRYPINYPDTYRACDEVNLNPGLIISANSRLIYQIGEESSYRARCHQNRILLTVVNDLLRKLNVEQLPILTLGWQDYLDSNYEFLYTLYPIIYSLSCCTFICAFLCILLLTKQNLRSQKPTWLIKLSTVSGSMYLLLVYIYSIAELYHQHQQNILSGLLLIDNIETSTPFNVFELIIVILLQLSQVQIITRLFPRRKEKRFAFIVGIFLSLTSQTIWSVATFTVSSGSRSEDPDYDSNFMILPAFVYLLRIAMSMLFSSLLVVYFFNKRQFIFSPRIAPLTLFTFVIMNSSFAVFVADVSSIWVSELSELFNITSYVVSNVVTWEFINRVVVMEKLEQKKGILGRQFYDDEEPNYLDMFGNPVPNSGRLVRKGKYDMIIASHDRDKSVSLAGCFETENDTGENNDNSNGTSMELQPPQPSSTSRLLNKLHKWTDITSETIFSVPIKGSGPSNSSFYDFDTSKDSAIITHLLKFRKPKKSQPNDGPTRAGPSANTPVRGQDVFVYQPKVIKVPSRLAKRAGGQRTVNYHTPTRLDFDEQDDESSASGSLAGQEDSRNGSIDEDIVYEERSYDFEDQDDNSV